MGGQNHHFVQYAPEPIPYAIERYVNETARLYAVMNKRLSTREYLGGDYSIADMACYPWVVPHRKQRLQLADFPHLQRWFDALAARPAVQAAYRQGAALNSQATVTDASRGLLFGQNAATIAREP